MRSMIKNAGNCGCVAREKRRKEKEEQLQKSREDSEKMRAEHRKRNEERAKEREAEKKERQELRAKEKAKKQRSTPSQSSSGSDDTTGAIGCGALLIFGLAWIMCGGIFMKVGIIIPGFDIEDYSSEKHWLPPWLDLWPDPRHGLFISGNERLCYAPGYDFCDCPSETQALVFAEDNSKTREEVLKERCLYSLSLDGEILLDKVEYKKVETYLEKNEKKEYFVFTKDLGDWKPSKEIFVPKKKKREPSYVDIEGSGGWKYRKHKNGDIEILQSPTPKSVGKIIKENKDKKAWKAINKEIEEILKDKSESD